jgi:hypothetical protein
MSPKVFAKKAAVQEAPTPEELAEHAVVKYHTALELLENMQQAFKASYPDAYASYQNILSQLDVVQERLKEAHILVQAAKETTGEFKCTRKWKSEGYDPETFVTLLGRFDKAGQVMNEMVKLGIVQKVTLSNRAAEFFANHPEYDAHFQAAWRDKEEMTAAVSVPKVSAAF